MNAKFLTLLGVTAATVALAAEPEVPYPVGYRDWHHVKSMVIENGHPLYGAFGVSTTCMPTTRRSRVTAAKRSLTAP